MSQQKEKIRVLWVSNIVFPEAAEALHVKKSISGGWMIGLRDEFRKSGDIELGIASMDPDPVSKEILTYHDGYALHYVIPGCRRALFFYDRRVEEYVRVIVSSFKPDIIHIHGSEYATGLMFFLLFPNIPCAISMQGVIESCAKVLFGDLRARDLVSCMFSTFDGLSIIKDYMLFRLRYRKTERRLLSRVPYAFGRTLWDYSILKSRNNDVRYYYAENIPSEDFYKRSWDIGSIEKHSILVSQGSVPLKGLHFVFEALRIVKRSFPDTKVYVAGRNIVRGDNPRARLMQPWYGVYLGRLIARYSLENNVVFTGSLPQNKMAERLRRSHLLIMPSVIENASNSAREAMIIGVPCISSFVGGMMGRYKDGEEILYYNSREPDVLAQQILRIFNSDELALRLSSAARQREEKRQDKKIVYSCYLDGYRAILEDWKNR
jgi:glycosyltransferase involved in cell wall biosynthesis